MKLPQAVETIRTAPVLHNRVVDAPDMPKAVKDILESDNLHIIKNIINSTFYVEKEHILEYNKNQLKTVNILKCTRPLLF